MSSKDDRRPDKEEEEVGAIDPRQGPVPTEAPEDEGIDTRDLETDRKQSDETENEGAKAAATVPASALLRSDRNAEKLTATCRGENRGLKPV